MLDAERLLADCDVRTQRRSGPGGQHRNKVETAVVITHRASGISAQASERRSQGENRRVALNRLRLQLALDVRSGWTANGATEPTSNGTCSGDGGVRVSELWRSRLRGGRIRVSIGHEDFAAILATALDVVTACGFDVKKAATALECSTSQLVRLLKSEPRAAAHVNNERVARDMSRLK